MIRVVEKPIAYTVAVYMLYTVGGHYLQNTWKTRKSSLGTVYL